MSRSRKRVPGFGDSEGSKNKAYYLRLMNRRIRRLQNLGETDWIPDGNCYRQFIERWDFRDCSFRYFTERELRECWYGPDRLYKATMKW